MKRKTLKLTEQVRQAIENCGKTRYQISQDTGIDRQRYAGSWAARAGCRIRVLDTLGEYLGLRIVADKPRTKKGR